MLPGPAHVVITVHGIRTFGQWQRRLERLLRASNREIEVRHLDYGWFSSLAYLLPFTRWLAVRRVQRLLAFEFDEARGARVDIVAHSFGTYLVAKALVKLAASGMNFRVHTVLLSGSVLNPWFNWSPLGRSPTAAVSRIVNDCGVKDTVLILGLLVPFSGMAGRIGFRGVQGRFMRNRYFAVGHSGFFETNGEPNDFMERHWIPVLMTDDEVEWQDVREGTLAGWQTLLLRNAEPVRLSTWGLLGLLALRPLQELSRKNASLSLAAESEATLEAGNVFSALILATEASRRSSTLEARDAFLRALTQAPFAPRVLASEPGWPQGFTRRGQLLALLPISGWNLGTLSVFELETGAKDSLALQAYEPFRQLEVSRNGILALALSRDSTLRLWSLQSDQRALTKDFDGNVAAAAFDRDGQAVAVATPGRLSTYALEHDLTPLHSVVWEPRWGSNWVTVGPGGRFVVVSIPFGKGVFALVDMVTGTQRIFTSHMLGERRTFGNEVRLWWANAAAISDDGSLLVVGGCKAGLQDPCIEGYVAAIDVGSATVRHVLDVEAPGGVWDVDLQPRGSLVAATAADRLILWNADATREPIRPENSPLALHPRLPTHRFRTAAFSGDGQTLAAGGWDGMMFWDLTRRNVIATASHLIGSDTGAASFPANPKTAVVSPDGRFEYRVNPRILWDVAAQRVRDSIPFGIGPQVFAFSPDGDVFVTSAPRGTTGGPGGVRVVRLNAKHAAPLFIGSGTRTPVSAVAFSPNGELLATGDQMGGIRLWDVSTWRALGPRLEWGSGEILELRFSSAGDTLVSRHRDGIVVKWSLGVRDWMRIACRLTKRAVGPETYRRTCE